MEALGGPSSRSVCQGKAETFLMGCIGHTGSSAIISTLYQHSELRIPVPFEPLRLVRDAQMQIRVTTSIFENVTSNGYPCGFKVRPEHIGKSNIDDWKQLVSNFSTRFISLTRQNVFLTGIGLYSIRALLDRSAMMGLRGVSSDEHCKSDPSACHFSIDDVRFLAYLMLHAEEGNRHVMQLASTIPWPCRLDITYEEYVSNPEEATIRIYDFLGVQHEDRQPFFQKALPKSPCQIVTNYQEVCATLWGCPNFQPFLEQPSSGCYCEDKTRPVTEELCDLKKLNEEGNVICYEWNEMGERKDIPCSVSRTSPK